jgi:sarcosine oxidase subunit alpha
MDPRITEHPVLGHAPARRRLSFRFNGQEIAAVDGDSIASALLAAGIRTIRRAGNGEPRGLYCGVGHCYECRVTVDGVGAQRACLVPAADGMVIEDDAGSGS